MAAGQRSRIDGSSPAVVLATPAPVTHRTAEENLGLGYIAAVLRRDGYSVTIIDGWLEGLTTGELASRIIKARPVMVGFSCYRSNMAQALETLRAVRADRPELLAVAGGYGPTFHAAEFLASGFDIVVRGEGEPAISALAEHAVSGRPPLDRIPGICYRTTDGLASTPPAPKPPLDSLPEPERDTLELTIARRSLVHIQTARGCQASCTFCSIIAFERVGGGATWRQRSIPGIVDEIEHLHARGARHFKVVDDSLLEPPRGDEWCEEFADEIAARGLKVRLRGSVRADRVTERSIRELRRAGFFSFSCGIENFSSSALSRMAKRASVEQNIAALDTFHRHGMYVQAGHILFDDRTQLSELYENLRYMRTYSWTISKGVFTEMFAAEGTGFTRRLRGSASLSENATGLGNHCYAIDDGDVRAVYLALKRWHRSHIGIYDQAIDPLSAPKALDEDGLRRFHDLYMELRDRDLQFFGNVLDEAARSLGPEGLGKSLDELVHEQIDATTNWYEEFSNRVRDEYRVTGLTYDADINPFVC